MNKRSLTLAALAWLAVAGSAPAQTAATGPDLEAGRVRATTVCSACHGANGVSVADNIPNLAAQKPAYLSAQLRALKDGTRKNAVMAAIAAQLSAADIANVAAYFASQPGAGAAAAKSDMLPSLVTTQARLPEGYPNGFTM